MSNLAGSGARHDYLAFGMAIRSALPLPAAEPRDGGPLEVEVAFARTPDALAGAVHTAAWFQATPGRLLLAIDGVARYFVEAGRSITIEPAVTASDDEVRVFLLGSAFGALLHQRGVPVLHASAIDVGGEAVAFLGDAGAGKSTLASALEQRGFPVLTDDLCAIRPGPRPSVEPGLRRTKLKPDALEQLGIHAEALPLVDQRTGKRAVPVGRRRPLAPLPIRKIYELRASERDETVITPLRGTEKFDAVMRHTYRLCFIEGLGLQASHFSHALALAGRIDLSVVERPVRGFRLRELADRIAADFGRARTTPGRIA